MLLTAIPSEAFLVGFRSILHLEWNKTLILKQIKTISVDFMILKNKKMKFDDEINDVNIWFSVLLVAPEQYLLLLFDKKQNMAIKIQINKSQQTEWSNAN